MIAARHNERKQKERKSFVAQYNERKKRRKCISDEHKERNNEEKGKKDDCR